MRRTHSRLWGAIWFVTVFASLTAMFAATYFLTGFLIKTIHLRLPGVLIQVINSLLGLFMGGLLVSLVVNYVRKRGWIPEINVFSPIIEALERIAKGDFRTRLENPTPDNQIMTTLANSVNKMALELEQMETLRQEFISNVSHEIQSPLTSIRGFAQALEDENLTPDERRHYLSIIETESARLSRITENLLRLAALDSEKARCEPKPYRLDKQIRSLALACEPQWAEKNLDMQVSLAEVEIVADEDLLSQVWSNLIHNSIKFTPPGGQICIDLQKEGQVVAFRIQDTGIGIQPEDQARVFERFFKADPSRTKASGGSGLGLAIAKKIVEMHQGKIEVTSTPGVGTAFTVRLNANRTPLE